MRVSANDIDFLRFLWWPKRDASQRIVEHCIVVHLLGEASSPSYVSFEVKRTADANKLLSPRGQDTIKNKFYVDDCLKSMPSDQDALQLVKDPPNCVTWEDINISKAHQYCRTLLQIKIIHKVGE